MLNRLLLASLSLFTPCLAQGQSGALQWHQDRSGKLRLQLPVAWKGNCTGLDARKDTREAVLTILCQAPEVAEAFRVYVFQAKGGHLRAISHAGTEFPLRTKDNKWATTKLLHEPVPQIWMRDPRGKRSSELAVYVRRMQRVYTLFVNLPQADLDKVKPALLAAAQSMQSQLPRVPAAPERYKRKMIKGYEFFLGKGVRTVHAKKLEKIIREEVKAFEAFHGKVPRPADEPLQIVLSKDIPQQQQPRFEDLLTRPHGMFAAAMSRRIYAVRFDKKKDRGPYAAFVSALWAMLFAETYGAEQPHWAHGGEKFLAEMRAATGKKAPWVTEGWRIQKYSFLNTFDKLLQFYRDPNLDDAYYASVYVSVFHHGPEPYRAAYEAFLRELRQTCNYEPAVKKHLHSLDQKKLFDDAKAYWNAMQVLKQKRR